MPHDSPYWFKFHSEDLTIAMFSLRDSLTMCYCIKEKKEVGHVGGGIFVLDVQFENTSIRW